MNGSTKSPRTVAIRSKRNYCALKNRMRNLPPKRGSVSELLSERLIAIRDSGGRVGLMDEFCAQIGEPGDCEPLDAGDVPRPSTRPAATPGRAGDGKQ
jgi:hypothetical protein